MRSSEVDVEVSLCRFCFDHGSVDDRDNPLIRPCACRGGSEYIHADCLLRWQRVVLIAQPTHPAYWRDDDRSNVCGVCKTTFKTPPPSRLTLMSSFTGAEIAAMVDEDFLLVSHAAFSERLKEKLQDMTAGLRRICGYEHWIDGTYLITKVRERERDSSDEEQGDRSDSNAEREAGEDLVVAVNLNGRKDLDEVVRGESRLFELVDGGRVDGRRAHFVLNDDGAFVETSDGDDEDEDSDGEVGDEMEENAEEREGQGARENEHQVADAEDEGERNDDDAEGERGNAGRRRVRAGNRDRRGGVLMHHLRQLLSPFGPIYDVYQRYRRRVVLSEAFESVAREYNVSVDDVKAGVEVESFTGGPCDDDEVSLCLVVGVDDDLGYAKFDDGIERAMSLAFKTYRDSLRGDDEREIPGSIVKTMDNSRERVGVLTEFDDELKSWKVATTVGLLKRTRDAFEIIQSVSAVKLLVFFGDARWSRSQLLGEIARGHWGLTKSDPLHVANSRDAYKRAAESGLLVFAPLTEITEEFMRNSLGEMNRIRSSGQLTRATSPAPSRQG